MKSLKTIIADDYPLFREGLEQALMQLLPHASISLASTDSQVFELLENEDVNLIFLDIRMSGHDGIEIIKRIRKVNPVVKIVAITMIDDKATMDKIFESGANGYIHKNIDKCMLQRVIEVVFNGDLSVQKATEDLKKDTLFHNGSSSNGNGAHNNLSDREIEILVLICKQYSSKEIANELCLTEKTVETHRNHLMWKTQSKNVVGLTMYAIERKYFKLEYRNKNLGY